MKTLLKPLLGIALAGLLGQAQAADPITIRLGTPDQGAGSEPFIAGPMGLAHIQKQLESEFSADGVNVEWRFFKGAGPAVNEALANQQLDFAWLGDLAAIIGRSSGLQTRLLLGARGSNTYLATRAEAQIHSLADLKGKRVAVYRGTADQLSFARALAAAGLKEQDQKIISLDWSAARAALASGQIDATWAGMGILSLGTRGVQFPLSTKQLPRRSTTQAGLVATQSFIDQHPDLAQRLVNVLVKNAAWLTDEQNQPAYYRLMAEHSAIPAELFEQESAGDDLAFRNSPRIDDFLRASLQDSIDQARALGLIRRPFTATDWVEPRFVDAALTQLPLDTLWPAFDANGKAL